MQDILPMKVLGCRIPSRGGIVSAADFLDLVIQLRRGKPFIPRGLHRFRTFEEAEAWSMEMMARRSNPAPQVSAAEVSPGRPAKA
jgi:hypothetical protein